MSTCIMYVYHVNNEYVYHVNNEHVYHVNNEYMYHDTLKTMSTSYTGVNIHIVKLKYQMKLHFYKYLGNKRYLVLCIMDTGKNKKINYHFTSITNRYSFYKN